MESKIKKKIIIPILVIIALFIIIWSMLFTFPSKAEVERYFKENKCISCSGEAYGEVYQMRRQTAMLWGKIFRIRVGRKLLNYPLHITTPFNYYQDLELVPISDEGDGTFHRYTWVDTKEGRLVYDAVKGEYVKEIDDKEDPSKKYSDEISKLMEIEKKENKSLTLKT